MNGTAAGVGLNDRLVRIFGSSASLRDALVLLAAAVLTIVLEMFVDLLPTLAGWSRQHPAWQIDTLFTLGFVLAIGFFAFAFRRMREIGEVARRRSDAEARFRDFAAMADEWFWEMDDQLRLSVVDDQAPAPLVALAKQRAPWQPRSAGDDAWARHRAELAGRKPFRGFRFQITDDAGSVHHIQISGRPFFDRDGSFCGYRGTGTDVTAVVTAEAASAHLAHFDPLTDLPNRTQLCDEVDHAAALARGRGQPGGAAAHRSRPLSRDQRHAWALDRRSAAQGLRAAPGGVHRCWRPPGAHQRRRVRDRAARPGAAGRRNAAVSPCAGELHRAVRSRRPGGDRWRQRRRRPDRRRRGERRGDQERRHRALSRQARGARHLLRVRAGDGGAAAPAPRARVGPRARPGGGRVSAGLPAADRRRDADRRGDRGAGPLAAPRARPARCQGLHRRGRRDRPDPAARPMGPAHGLRAGRAVAGAAGRGQPVADAVSPSRPGRPGRRGAAGERPRGRPPRARDSRERAAARSAGRRRHSRATARPRRAPGARATSHKGSRASRTITSSCSIRSRSTARSPAA